MLCAEAGKGLWAILLERLGLTLPQRLHPPKGLAPMY